MCLLATGYLPGKVIRKPLLPRELRWKMEGLKVKKGTHQKVLFVGQHKFRRAGVVGAIRFVNDKFIFLLFPIRDDG